MAIPKKVYYLFHVSSIGGGTLCLYNLIRELNRDEYDPTVILSHPGPLSDLLSRENVPVVYIPHLKAYPYNRSLAALTSLGAVIGILHAMCSLYRLLSARDCQLLHINSFMLFPYALVSKALGIKTIIHYREHWPPKEHRIQFSLAREIVKHCAQHVLAINENAARQLSMSEKTTVVYDWIDLNRRYAEGTNLAVSQEKFKDSFNFLFVGGLQSSKGIFEVVQAFRACCELVNCRLIIVGCDKSDGIAKGFRAKTKSLLQKFGWKSKSQEIMEAILEDPRIILLPSISDMKGMYEMAHALVAFPRMPHAILPIAEALSVGLPVVASNLPESREYSSGNKGIVFVAHGDVEGLTERLAEMYKNWEYFRREAELGSTRVAARFGARRNIALVENVYATLLTS